MRVCAITNVYNEFFNLPIWLSYYGRQVGPENCIVVDHGSDHLPDLGGASLLRTPRSVFDDGKRARTIANLANAMLEHYDAVLYTDADEILLPDPAKYSGLIDFLSRTEQRAYTAIGLDLPQHVGEEEPLDPSRPVMDQRSNVVFNSWLCKTLITRDPIRWSGGFHAADVPPQFGELYLIHLRASDLGEAMRRGAQTRRVQVVHPDMGAHHRWPTLTFIHDALNMTHLERRGDLSAVPRMLEEVLELVKAAPDGLFYITQEVRPPYLMKLPESFRGAF